MQANEPFHDSFSSPQELTSGTVDAFDGKLSGVYIISLSPSLAIAAALTIESGNIRKGLQKCIAKHSNQSLFFMYHRTEEGKTL